MPRMMVLVLSAFVGGGLAGGTETGKPLSREPAVAATIQSAASRPGAPTVAEGEREKYERTIRELKAEAERLTVENAKLRERLTQLEGRSGKPAAVQASPGKGEAPRHPDEKVRSAQELKGRDPELERRSREVEERYKLEGGRNSDRGRTYIKYGPPNSTEVKDGVEVWHYTELPGVGRNVEIRFGGAAMKTIWVKMDRP